MIPNLTYTNKDLYVFNEVKSRPTCLFLDLNAISLQIRGFCHLVNILTSTLDKVNIYTKKKF